MRHASIRALYAYWAQLSAGRLAPERREINPKAIARELGDLFILDGEVETFAFRLAGSRLVHSLGRDVTGTSFLSIFDHQALKTAHDMLVCTAREAEPVLIGIRDAATVMPRPAAPTPVEHFAQRRDTPSSTPPSERRRAFEGHGELLLLPLLHRGKIGDRLFGAMALFDPPALARDGAIELAITGTRVLGRNASPRTPLGLVRSDLADQVISRRGHLALLRGGTS